MLDIKTKNSIDRARNILVGKIPSPSSQVEQITIAMLYKFMDDMDLESVNLGGKPTFFADKYEQYSWHEIMSKTVSAQDRYNRYTKALEEFYTHPSLPQTFKDVFKNATVPFKEAEILTMFLKEIDSGLSYDDSEQLGDAYEYLLSVLGSQGDLGQFRTPRHIIDFIVELVDPKKDELILDPACGTAGFLISAYKHIIRENTDKTPGDKLNFDEKMEILKHITGYDIEPSMVRIAEMNMFLHGASDPDIFEYDTLTNDDKWDEKFNVILANPPFMTPKGGIKPHNKFGVKANRSEILFVDYIQSHLRVNGRAGVIVPDGVVSKKDKSYQIVRKELLDNSLYAVISLPAGVFYPYSPVSTFILLLDKQIAKESSEIIFADLSYDGFALNKNRKPIKKNEIPEFITLLKEIKDGKEVNDNRIFKVSKEVIAENNYDLKLNNYKNKTHKAKEIRKPNEITKEIEELEQKNINLRKQLNKLFTAMDKKMNSQEWETKPLRETCEFYNGKAHEKVIDENGEYILINAKFISTKGTTIKRTNANLFPLIPGDVTMVMSDVPNGKALARTFLIEEENKYTLNQRICALRSKSYNPKFLSIVLNRHKYLLDFDDGNSQTNLRKDDILDCEVILPPIEIQNEYVEIVKCAEELQKTLQLNLESVSELIEAKTIEYFSE